MFECCEEQVDWTAALAILQLQDCRGGCGLLQAAPAAVLQSQLPQTTSSPPPQEFKIYKKKTIRNREMQQKTPGL